MKEFVFELQRFGYALFEQKKKMLGDNTIIANDNGYTVDGGLPRSFLENK